MILGMRPEVVGEIIDPSGQDRDLNAARSGVRLVLVELLYRRCFFKRHVIYSRRAVARSSPKFNKPRSLLELQTAVKDVTARVIMRDTVYGGAGAEPSAASCAPQPAFPAPFAASHPLAGRPLCLNDF